MFALAALDELSSGVPVVGSPDIERAFGTSHATLALLVFVVPGLVALAFEPALFLLADRHPRHHFIRGGLAAMAMAALACAFAPGPIVLAAALSVAAVATGTATGLAQATLVDRAPDTRGKTLARWALWSLGGDLAAPILLGGLSLLGASWRMSFAIVGVALGLAALGRFADAAPAAAAAPTDDGDDNDGPHVPLLAALRDALHDRRLVAWLLGVALCDLFDEIFVVFASLHARGALGMGALGQSAVVAAFMVGSAGGLFAIEQLLRVRSERWLLVASALATVAAFVPWLFASSPVLAVVLAAPVGAASAPLYPLAAAQAYAQRPEKSGSVLAAGHLFTPLGLAMPWLVGLVADAAGTSAALALLVAQPLGLLLLVVTSA